MFIEWKDEYLIGNPLIDYDHQTLVNLTNELYERVRAGEGQARIADTIRCLIEYVERHFAREEEIFRATDYPDADAHAEKHRQIEKTVRDIAARYQTDPGAIDADEVLAFLQKWLTNHILRTDRTYLPYIQE
jgi:hemerythrin